MPVFGTDSRNAAEPDRLILSTLEKRPGQCICSWVIYRWAPNGQSIFRLKWHNWDCPVPRERHETRQPS